MGIEKKQRVRLYGLDLLCIMAMAIVFIGHSANQFGCNYWYFAPLTLLRSTAMTLFFILSGFVLYYNYYSKNLFDLKIVKNYYIKRVSGILPTYYLVAVLYILFIGKENFGIIVKLLPIEALGLQSTVSSLFSISHNGGTWFVSCLLISYFFYPYMQELIKSFSLKINIILLVGISAFLTYIPFLSEWFSLSGMYENLFCRGSEFILGILLARLVLNYKKDLFKEKIKWENWSALLLFLSPLFLFLVLLYKDMVILNVPSYQVLRYPLLCCMVIGSGILRLDWVENISIIHVSLKYLSGIAYEFFLAQFFTWKISEYIIILLQNDRNVFRVVISFIVCLMLATFLHYLFTKPISSFMIKTFVKE